MVAVVRTPLAALQAHRDDLNHALSRNWRDMREALDTLDRLERNNVALSGSLFKTNQAIEVLQALEDTRKPKGEQA